jgi:hypothetical protein
MLDELDDAQQYDTTSLYTPTLRTFICYSIPVILGSNMLQSVIPLPVSGVNFHELSRVIWDVLYDPVSSKGWVFFVAEGVVSSLSQFPMSILENLANSDPCSGFVKMSATIWPVGKYSNMISFDST